MDKLAGKTFSLDVTDEYIRQGVPECGRMCAVALATENLFQNKFGYAPYVSVVGKILVDFEAPGSINVFRFNTDDVIGQWIKDFDNQVEVEPISIDLHIEKSEVKEYDHITKRYYFGRAFVKE